MMKLVVGIVGCFCAVGSAALWSTSSKDRTAQTLAVDMQPGGHAVASMLEASQDADASPASRRDEAPLAALTAPPPAEDPQMVALTQAKDGLDAYATMSLNGVMHVNDTLNLMLDFGSLPIADHPDFEYEDDDAIAYKLDGAPEGTEARVLVGMQPYEEDGRLFRYLQLDVDIDVDSYTFMDGAMRYNPNVNLSISYAVEDPMVPTRFAMMVQRDVALGESRKAGIDAYHGRYTTGAYYWVDLLEDPANPMTGTVGLVNSQRPSMAEFGGVMPLAGDIELDPDLLTAMLGQLQSQLAIIKGDVEGDNR